MHDSGQQDAAGRLVTVNERLLLHLRDFSLPRFRADVPPQVTQDGIAEALGIRPNHVPRAVRRLVGEGAVEEVTSHVSGYARRRKAYFLTERGLSIAEGVMKRLMAVNVEVETESGVTARLTIQKAQSVLPGKPGMTRLLRAMGEDGVVRLDALEGRPKVSEGFVDFSGQFPRSPNFFGRSGEMADLTKWLAGETPRVVIISGVKGIGKTALVLNALESARGKRNVFWHTFHAWDSPESLAEAIVNFASAAQKGQPKLDATPEKLPGVLKQALSGLKAVAVFDNMFELREETANLCQHLVEVFASTAGAKLLVTTRDETLCQRFRAYANSGAVAEIRLGGLDKESARKLVEASGNGLPDFDRVFAITSGHPLVLELVNSEEIRTLVDDSGLTPEEALVLRCLKAFDYILG
jgi:DNA-binding MarR family transcriptional regulator